MTEPLFFEEYKQIKHTIIVAPSTEDLIINNAYSHYWNFFHTMAQKMDKSAFQYTRGREFVFLICRLMSTISCQICRDSAEEYIRTHGFYEIMSQEQFKLALFHFHNDINAKNHKPLFTIEELNEKYSKMDVILVIKQFIINLQKDYKYDLYITNDELKMPFLMYVKDWLNENYRYFL